MQGNHGGSWFRPPAGDVGRGGGSYPGFRPQVHPFAPNFNVQQPNIYPLFQYPPNIHHLNPTGLPGFSIGNPSFPVQQTLNFPPPQPPSFRPHNYSGGGGVLPQAHGQSFSHSPQQPFSNSMGNDEGVSSQIREVVEVSEKCSSKPKRKVGVNRIDTAVDEACKAMIAAGENVSSSRVSESVLSTFNADSWRSLGVQMQDVPSLRRLMAVEGKINAFIHCFVGVRRIVTLYDLEVAICKSEVVDCFDDLELGPLLRHPLVLLYFPSISGADGPCQITSEEIISFLDDFLDVYEKNDVKLDEFLNFVAKKKSVTSKEELCVRIQSLGMYVSFIRHAKRQEGEMLRILWTELQQKYGVCWPKKQQQDDHSRSVSERVESFSFVHKEFRGKHIRFDLSSSDDEYSDDFAYAVNDVNSSDHVSSCPYPSAAEEMKRLESSKKKRKAENLSPGRTEQTKFRRTDHLKQDMPKSNDDCDNTKEGSNVNEDEYTLSDEALKSFISIWKDTCKELNMAVVVKKMLNFYSVDHEKGIRRRRISMSSFPYIGLLNVAVTSIRCGMWDSVYDNLRTIRQDNTSDEGSEFEIIEVKQTEKHESLNDQHVLPQKPSVSVEEIIRRLSVYFDHEISGEKHINFLRRLHNCGVSLAEYFQVKDFESLGYGAFSIFLEKHLSLLPTELQKFLNRDMKFLNREMQKEYPFEVCIHEKFLTMFLCQSSEFSADCKVFSSSMVSALFTRQFPSLDLNVVENGSTEISIESIRSNVSSKSVVFSATVLGVENSLACGGKYLEESSVVGNDTGSGTKTMSSITSKDAFDVLLRAPLLSDLNAWCHWDLTFAPSLGPLVQWLLKGISSEELLCVVTKDGKVIRIDPSATGDAFLEAALQGSPYHTAVKLLSLISSNGRQYLPFSLLKCYAQRAFEAILNNHLAKMELDDDRNSLFDMLGPTKLSWTSADLIGEVQKAKANKTEDVASRFFLDCLGYFPSEFRGLAADILVSGLRSVVKSAPVRVLFACKGTEERIMLHDVGLLLGIVEWINDYHLFCSSFSSNSTRTENGSSDSEFCTSFVQKESQKLSHSEQQSMVLSEGLHECNGESYKSHSVDIVEALDDSAKGSVVVTVSEFNEDPASIINSIRQDEFGLDSSPSSAEKSMLQKQHARLGRALQCLSQELYSQDSHFILELVQNADDNSYPKHVEPTLTFILQKTGIVVLNNEHGFSHENIRALCDIGQSTKKGSGGYIGKKGIGFKSVFRVSDAPEIHSNGFHVKFDISEGQIGFVLPTVVPPYDIDSLSFMLSSHASQLKNARWNTCIRLPFRSITTERTSVNHIEAMFSDLHPSLLLFLHRLQCIVYRNMLEDSLLVMRKEIVGENIIKVSCGENNMTWFVASEKLRAVNIRDDAKTTEIAIAFTLDEPEDGTYRSHVIKQPVFAFLPLRTYGLKFILQGDFILTSSREEVDEDSPWNQWLLSEFPGLFLNALRTFCTLPIFRENLGKAVTSYMQFVPLPGEVHGFFSSLPRAIISKLRTTDCMLLEGVEKQWVPPYKVLRAWNENARVLLSDGLLQEHLGLGFLDKDIIMPDTLSKALGIEDYGPKILVQVLSSISHKKDGLRSMGLAWLSSFLIELHMLFHPSGRGSVGASMDRSLVDSLRKIPFIPLSNGTFSSLNEGGIWLHHETNASGAGDGFEVFPVLYSNLRIVDHSLLLASSGDGYCTVDNLVNMLCAIGVQKLSAHEIIKVHILPAFGGDRSRDIAGTLIVDFLCFVMTHLQTGCHVCHTYREDIMSELRNNALILTNYGLKRQTEVSIHFGEEFGNRVNVKRLTKKLGILWHEVDNIYLNHSASKYYACGLKKWRDFFREIGITDFVQVVQVEKSIAELYISNDEKRYTNLLSPELTVIDWESPELVYLLSLLCKSDDREGCKYLLEVLDTLWDECYYDKTTFNCNPILGVQTTSLKSSFMRIICNTKWIVSSIDNDFHCSSELFHDCDETQSILGTAAPYAVPKVTSAKLLNDIGLKTKVSLDDALEILKAWGQSGKLIKASISQMTRFYKFLWNEASVSMQKLAEKFYAFPSVFVPHETDKRQSDAVTGVFLSVEEVYWKDSAGILDQMKQIDSQISRVVESLYSKILCDVYPGLHDFFVTGCGVPETPSFHYYLQILRQLAHDVSPSSAAKAVFKFFVNWSDELKSGKFSEDVLLHLKERLSQLDFAVLPTEKDNWVSLHSSFGLVCWCDDNKLKKRFKHKGNIQFIYFGDLSDEEQEILRTKVSSLMHSLGIPSISQVVTREAKYEGLRDNSEIVSLVNWALPFAQRYIYTLHLESYLQKKKLVYSQLKHLKILAVEKLCYKNVIHQFDIKSKKELKCNCLLQDNALYATSEADSHSLFMELSRLLLNGTPDLHLANFLHMIKTMAESGLKEEQMEVFILNSQKVQKIPDQDRVWFLKSALKGMKKAGISTSWPPASCKREPSSSTALVDDAKKALASNQAIDIKKGKEMDASEALEEQQIPIEITDANLIAACDDVSGATSQIRQNQWNPAAGLIYSTSGISARFNANPLHESSNSSLPDFTERDQLHTGTPWAAQALQTGRLGEAIAFRYFVGKNTAEGVVVKWVNEYNETGLPYDIVMEDRSGKKEYIEVKATISARKDWFNLSVREWQFAYEKGESYSIAHVLVGNTNAILTQHKNPVKLCQEGRLRLVILMPKQQNELLIGS